MRDLNEKQAKARAQIEDKMVREEQQRLEHEAMVQRMEQEELELIQRLQNTQLLQKAAYEDLENALGGNGQTSTDQENQARPGTQGGKRVAASKPGSKAGTRR